MSDMVRESVIDLLDYALLDGLVVSEAIGPDAEVAQSYIDASVARREEQDAEMERWLAEAQAENPKSIKRRLLTSR
jgi:hypothetical protein